MNPRIKYYLMGVFLGCLILIAFPRAFHLKRPPPLEQDAIAVSELFPIKFRDGYNRSITIKFLPRRIISMAPSITEILFALGAEDNLLADTVFCNYPEAARSLTRIGDLRHPDLELMVRLQPDLVLGTVLSPANLYRRLEDVGLEGIAFRHDDFDGVIEDMKLIGKITGRPGAALRLVASIRERRDFIRRSLERVEKGSEPRVVVLYDLDRLYSAGKGSWVGDLVALCRARNVAEESPSAWPQLSREGLIAADPQVLILAVGPDPQTMEEAEKRLARLSEDPVWQPISAIRDHRVKIINKELFDIPGPRMADALEALARAIHPEIFKTEG